METVVKTNIPEVKQNFLVVSSISTYGNVACSCKRFIGLVVPILQIDYDNHSSNK